jgi:uncharacterized protein YukE
MKVATEFKKLADATALYSSNLNDTLEKANSADKRLYDSLVALTDGGKYQGQGAKVFATATQQLADAMSMRQSAVATLDTKFQENLATTATSDENSVGGFNTADGEIATSGEALPFKSM